MSRIGKIPVEIKENVKVVISGRKITVSGPKGELNLTVHAAVKIEANETQIKIKPVSGSKSSREQYGLTRTLISNMVTGVTEGFEKRLEFKGVGYRASVENGKLVMALGFSHPTIYTPKQGVEIRVEKNTIIVNGIDKQMVGQTAAEIRALKKPEPYKGKGIRYEGERIRRKAGKAAVKSGG